MCGLVIHSERALSSDRASEKTMPSGRRELMLVLLIFAQPYLLPDKLAARHLLSRNQARRDPHRVARGPCPADGQYARAYVDQEEWSSAFTENKLIRSRD